MKKEDLVKALGEIDDDLLAAAAKQRFTKPAKRMYMRRSLIPIGIAAAAIAAVAIINRPSPAGGENVVSGPENIRNHLTGTEESAPEVIALSHHLENSGSAGFAIEMYPDLTEETDYNPWNEEMILETLPVFERIPSETGAPYGLSEEEIRANLEKYMAYFNFEADEFVSEPRGIPEKGVETGPVYMISAFNEDGYMSSDGYGEIILSFKSGHGIDLPEGITLSRTADDTEAVKAVNYLYEQYGELLKGNDWGYDIGGDYTYDGSKIRRYALYAKGKGDEETLLNYNFAQIIFSGSEDGTKLDLIRIRNETCAYEEAGQYPLITAEEAYQQLCEGNYFANANGIGVNEKTEIADVQLTYLNYRSFRYSFPCYVFRADISQQVSEFLSAQPEGLRSYGLYYVPAIAPEYIEWEDEPHAYQPPQETETAEQPAEETVNPEKPPVETVYTQSAMIPLERIIQQENYYCTVACVQMILEHFGTMSDQASLAKQLNTYKPGERSDGITGTYDTDAARVLNEYIFGGQPQSDTDGGYRVQPVMETFDETQFNTFARRMKRNIDDGYPSIIQVKVNSLYGGSTTVNHNVLITGYTETKNILTFTLLDPYYDGNTGNGISEFEASHIFNAIVESYEPSYIW